MIKKANPTLEGQLLEYLETAPDAKSEVMWNVLQHLRARQRGESIENPTLEGQIAEYFESAPLEKAEVLFNIIELKLGKRMERQIEPEVEEPRTPEPPRSKKAKPESKGKARAAAAAASAPVAVPEPAPAAAPAPAEPANESANARVFDPVVVANVHEPVMVPVDEVEEMDHSGEDLEGGPVAVDDVA